MNDEEMKKILAESYEEPREDSLVTLIKDFYNWKMLSTIVLVWGWGLACCGAAIYCGIRFFQTDQIQSQIMYATLFVTFVLWLSLMKIFAWQMIHRKGIKREIKRLEIRIAELHQAVIEKIDISSK